MIAPLARGRKPVLVLFGLLLILSLDNALSYNLHHLRHADTLVDSSFSGWKTNLLFPQESRRPWRISAANGMLLLAWIAALAALLIGPVLANRSRSRSSAASRVQPRHRTAARLAFAACALFVVCGSIVAALTGDWTGERYLPQPAEAALQAAERLDAIRDCTICIASPLGRVDAPRLSAALDTIDPAVAARPRTTEWLDYNEWIAMPGRIRAWYLEAYGREPAPGDVGHLLYQWREEHVPAAEIRRRIFAAASAER
jgi:hypothetical protein